MIKVDIKTDVLKETKINRVLGVDCKVEASGEAEILTEEVYRLVKTFECEIPNIWCNVVERLMNDAMEGDKKE